MLQKLSDRSQGVMAWGIVILIAIAFSIFGLGNYFADAGSSQIAAKVNDRKIGWYEVDRQFQAAMRNVQADIPPENQRLLKNDFRQEIVRQYALLTSLQKQGFRANEELILGAIQSNSDFQDEGEFSSERYLHLLKANDYSDPEYRKLLKDQIVVGQFQHGLQGSSMSLPSEAEYNSTLWQQTRSFKYVKLSFQDFMGGVNITPEQIKAFYNAHKAQFMTEESVTLEYVTLALADISIKNDKDKEKAESIFAIQLEDLRNLAFENSDNLDVAANTLGLKTKSTQAMTREGGKESLTQNPKILEAVFSEEVFQQRNNSDVIQLSEDEYAVVRIKDYFAPEQRTLESVTKEIKEQLTKQEAKNILETKANELYAALNEGKSPAIKQTWFERKSVSRMDKTVEREILMALFKLHHPTDANKTPIGKTQLTNGDIVIVKLLGVGKPKEVTPKETIENQLAYDYGQTEFALYANDMVDRANVKLY